MYYEQNYKNYSSWEISFTKKVKKRVKTKSNRYFEYFLLNLLI
ncbi:MAG: hypothetical protein BAJALOKI2v1_740008 [Promethearchaeota archaeon]|nr:MAG: hypothetical protein BAJALOKI2v1_740008 [Candidatus Lokiarchaeota archaeon]